MRKTQLWTEVWTTTLNPLKSLRNIYFVRLGVSSKPTATPAKLPRRTVRFLVVPI